MKNVFLFFSFIFLFACNREQENTTPPCLDSYIQNIMQSPVQNPKATIKKYNYKNKIVYYVKPGYPDAINTVLDENCNIICTDGGISGETTTPCVDWSTAVYIETVWTDPR